MQDRVQHTVDYAHTPALTTAAVCGTLANSGYMGMHVHPGVWHGLFQAFPEKQALGQELRSRKFI
jgi:hypothetical protein